MKKNGFNLVIFIALTVCFTVLFAGCSGGTNEQVQNNNENSNTEGTEMAAILSNISEYTIIRGDSSENYETEAAKTVRSILSRLSGADTAIATDWIDTDTGDIDSKKEILIGKTNRPQSEAAVAALAGNDYIVRADGNKLVIAADGEAAMTEAVKYFLSSYFGYAQLEAADPNEVEQPLPCHNVVAYGATGDGTTDDTEAFKAAVNAAMADGLPVYVPGGRYSVTDTITLESVTMYGYETGAWTADNCDLPVVCHKDMSKPLFDVKSGALSGIRIECAYTKDTAKAATVMVTGTGGRVTDMTIHNPLIAIKCDDASNPGRCYIGNIFIVQAYEMGVYVAGTFDVPLIENVEVWNPAETCPVAFRFAHNDDIRGVNLFAFNANVGFLINESKTGAFWGCLSNCSVDYTSIGMQIEGGPHHITINGGCWWVHHRAISIDESANGNIIVSGCEFKSNGDSAVYISGGTTVNISGCTIERIFNGGNVPAVRIAGGQMVNFSGNIIYSRNDGILIGAKGGIIGVTSNLINCGGNPIRDASRNAVVNTECNTVSDTLELTD